MKYNIYKTTNLVNGKFYWGVHNSIDENDGYLGGGTLLRKAIKKYGKAAFRRKTMVVYETAEAAYFDEALLVTKEYLDKNSMCYNLHPGGKGGFGNKKSDETRAKMGISKIGNKNACGCRTDEFRAECVSRAKGNKNRLGHKHSEESKKKMSEMLKGRKLSDETKKKMSISAKHRWETI